MKLIMMHEYLAFMVIDAFFLAFAIWFTVGQVKKLQAQGYSLNNVKLRWGIFKQRLGFNKRD